MKTLFAIVLLASTITFAADKEYHVDGKKVSAREAFSAANAGKEVLQCTQVELYENKSGLPVFKAKNSGTKWK